ncbi:MULTISPECIES: HEAT repeat domain-containing protein [unclassified Streptomyces]|uniref:HEAT repeat domain-containing protein n=1 Tax=unclassified Streptomyces TaxID=2593676 RepID=UPI002DDC159B|nr:HEAT repeat domain-containing protein [Streptomyces sp. NBC_00243]WRZ24459.1 HEAT repeat domain-containing protein [Streptomyces sp. NBC_00243]
MPTYETRRLVLRQRPGLDALSQLAEAADWTLLADNADQAYAQRTREQSWGVRHGLHVYAIADVMTDCCAVSVVADDAEDGEAFLNLLVQHLRPLSHDELHGDFTELHDPIDRVLRLIQLTLSAPEEFDASIFDRLVQAARDPDDRVRDTVTLASGYVAWPQVRTVLKDLAEHDGHTGVRRDAQIALETYDRAGIPDV